MLIECGQCGNATSQEEANCRSCGAPLPKEYGQSDTVELEPKARKAYRFASWFWIAYAIFGFWRVAADPIGYASIVGLVQQMYRDESSILAIFFCMNAILVAVAIGMLCGKKWAHKTAVVLAWIGIVVSVLSLPTDFQATHLFGGVGLALLDDVLVIAVCFLTLWSTKHTVRIAEQVRSS